MFAADDPSSPANSAAWSGRAAAAYLDGRMVWWIGWKVAARDHGTFCVSCHTVVPYAMARPALRATLAEQAISSPEQQLLDNVTKRVRMWKEVEPAYPDETRGVHQDGRIARNRVHSQRGDSGELRRAYGQVEP